MFDDLTGGTSTTSGTGPLVLSGALAGFRNITAVLSNGNQRKWNATSGSDYMVFLGTYTTSPSARISVDAVYYSSNSDAEVNWSGDTINIVETARASDIFDMANQVEAADAKVMTAAERTAIAANTAARHDPVTVADTSEIDLTLTGQQISAAIVSGSIDETKLDASVNASLDLADSASQPGHGHTKSDLSDIADFLLESEVDPDIKTLSLPASTTISAFGATLVDDADAATARSTLGAASASHAHTASDVTDFDTEVGNHADVAANTAARHAAVTVVDSSEIDFTLTGQEITASLVAGSIDETKLDTSVNASLDLADSASQPGHAHTASDVTDFAAEVTAHSDVAANTAARHAAVTVSDTSEIDLTLTGQQLSAAIVAGSIDESKLDTSVNASLDLADSASQPGHTHTKSDLTDVADFLLESEVDADIKTLSLPASTTISAFGATLVDDADAATARATLGAITTLSVLDSAGSATSVGV